MPWKQFRLVMLLAVLMIFWGWMHGYDRGYEDAKTEYNKEIKG